MSCHMRSPCKSYNSLAARDADGFFHIVDNIGRMVAVRNSNAASYGRGRLQNLWDTYVLTSVDPSPCWTRCQSGGGITHRGKVTYKARVRGCYKVMVNVFEPDRTSPLSVRTYVSNVVGTLIKLSDEVTVRALPTRGSGSRRDYEILSINGERIKTMTNMCENESACDNVEFFFNTRYYSKKLLRHAFNMSYSESGELMRKSDTGFIITCRPSQFVRFLIKRDKMGVPNGFKDLKVRLVSRTPPHNSIDVCDRRVQCYQ